LQFSLFILTLQGKKDFASGAKEINKYLGWSLVTASSMSEVKTHLSCKQKGQVWQAPSSFSLYIHLLFTYHLTEWHSNNNLKEACGLFSAQ
jgi:hypothetical protein